MSGYCCKKVRGEMVVVIVVVVMTVVIIGPVG